MVLDCKRRYKDAKTFMTTFNPSNQVVYASYKDRCFTGNAPSLSVVSQSFGKDVVEGWVAIQIKDLSEFAGCKDKMLVAQIQETARIIASCFYYLKVTEIMYFFYLFKSGYYGKFFGSVDSIMITESLRRFISYRNDEIDRIEKQTAMRRMESQWDSQSNKAISYEEYIKRKKARTIQKID